MNNVLQVPLNAAPEQVARLRALQLAFSEVCNALAPVARESRCWNRVALHHMMYRTLRARFPQMGSQMVCNAIYSVSRTSRVVYQSPGSPFFMGRWGNRPLPLIQFAPTAPVYFDRHTLSIKAGHLSMFTLDGRMRFELGLSPDDEVRFHEDKLAEIVLRSDGERFSLLFSFASGAPEVPAQANSGEWPEYVLVLPEPDPLAAGTMPARVSPLSGVSP
jgi:hypothetical protein